MALFKRSAKAVTPIDEAQRDKSLDDFFETHHYDDEPELGQEPAPVAVVANKYKRS